MELKTRRSILKQHQLRVTDCRLDVLEFFADSSHALSSRELEDRLQQYDRVTLYRTLNSFVDKGILHSIPDDSGFARYGVCHDTCGPHEHQHNHVHFKCEVCEHIECLPDYSVPYMEIPDYIVNGTELIINGICPDCSK